MRLLRLLAVFTVVAASVVVARQPAATRPVDLLVVNADIITMEPGLPRASALAVRQGTIVALGSEASLKSLRGPSTQVIDAGGKTVLPGFVDSHIHVLEYGQTFIMPSLNDKKLPEVEQLVRAEVAKGTALIRMRGWGGLVQEGQRNTTNELLDQWAPNTPVVVERGEGHVALYNTAALRALDVERRMKEQQIPDSYLKRDTTGRPTGVLVEEANWVAIAEVERRESDASRRRAVEEALTRLREVGVTSLQNLLFTTEVLSTYRTLLGEGRLTTRIDGAVLGRMSRDQKAAARASIGPGIDPLRLRVNAAKYFGDGSIGAGTAALLEPYSTDPTNRGILLWKSADDLAAHFEVDLALGLQTIVHGMGDGAIRMALDAFDIIATRHGPADYRFRIEHGNMPTPADFPRWRRLGVVWSYQPPAWNDRYRAGRVRTLGESRIEYTENVEDFLANGMPVAVGSDAPYYVDINPLVNVSNLAARHAHNAAHPRNIPVMLALQMATRGSAFAAREESSRGSLAPGKLADFVILSGNPLEVPPDEVRNIRVERTVLGGKTVFNRAETTSTVVK